MLRVADLHCDTIIKYQAGYDLSADGPRVSVSLPSLTRGGVGLQVMACFISSVLPEERAVAEARTLLALVDELCRRFPEQLRKTGSAAESAA